MRVMWIWHAAVVAEYRKPLTELGKHADVDIMLLTPKRWPERAGQMVHAEADAMDAPYKTVAARTLFTGFYYIYMFPSLLYQMLKFRPDVIYCYEEAHTFIAVCVLLFHKLFMPKSAVLLYAAQNIKKRYPLPFRLFEGYCFWRADAILACGTIVAQTLRSKGYRGALNVVPIPSDVHTFAPDVKSRAEWRQQAGLDKDAFVIGYAGKLVEEKGLRALLVAFGGVAKENPQAHLVLAGGGALHDELLATATEMGLAERVHLPGIIHNSNLPAFMNALDVFVLPSETRSNWREQFGRVAVEAMSCGVPVIGSDSGEIPTVLGNAGLVFHEGDSVGLAHHLRCLLDNPAERMRLAHAGRERVLRLFSVEQVARRHYELYNKYKEGKRG